VRLAARAMQTKSNERGCGNFMEFEDYIVGAAGAQALESGLEHVRLD
jgi:hypothetical protein